MTKYFAATLPSGATVYRSSQQRTYTHAICTQWGAISWAGSLHLAHARAKPGQYVKEAREISAQEYRAATAPSAGKLEAQAVEWQGRLLAAERSLKEAEEMVMLATGWPKRMHVSEYQPGMEPAQQVLVPAAKAWNGQEQWVWTSTLVGNCERAVDWHATCRKRAANYTKRAKAAHRKAAAQAAAMLDDPNYVGSRHHY